MMMAVCFVANSGGVCIHQSLLIIDYISYSLIFTLFLSLSEGWRNASVSSERDKHRPSQWWPSTQPLHQHRHTPRSLSPPRPCSPHLRASWRPWRHHKSGWRVSTLPWGRSRHAALWYNCRTGWPSSRCVSLLWREINMCVSERVCFGSVLNEYL